jgi:carbon storage regulator
MLVLSRKVGEQIMIADGIEITVLEVRSGKVRLGIDAPASIPVHRKEVFDRIHKNEKQQIPKPRTQVAFAS